VISIYDGVSLITYGKTNLTKKIFRSKRRSCAMCKPHKMHWDDSRTMQTVRASIGHKQALDEKRLFLFWKKNCI
jgi:hypothetical protein